MNKFRLPDYLDHMQQAATRAFGFVKGMNKDEFLADERTQDAVIRNLTVIGEAATKIMYDHTEFAKYHAEIQWQDMRSMRNRIVHDYVTINLDVVWDTVRTDLPELLKLLPAVLQAADDD
jgi:uncharacterized protein with HEPN domain